MKIKKALLITVLSVFGSCALAENLVILHTNDTHSQIDPNADDLGGVLRRKVVIDSVRSANNNVLLVDAGDIVQGTLYFNIYKGEVEEKVMNELGYDIRILGNHEFDNGLDAIADNLRNGEAKATMLTSNYLTEGTSLENYFMPYAIYEIENNDSVCKRIAFIALNLEPKGMIADRNYEGIEYVDASETANNIAWYLKNIKKADMVIALSHLGYNTKGKSNDIDVVKASKDIDLVIGGHTHTFIDPADPASPPYLISNAVGREILVAQTGKQGINVGEITIDLDNLTAVPQYRLIKIDSRLDDRIDPDFAAVIEPYRASVDSLNMLKVGKTAKYLDKESAALLNFASDFVAHRGRQLAENVDFAILNKGGLRNSLPKGDITEGQLITLMPFFNRIVVIDISGKDLIENFDIMAKSDGNGVSSEVAATYDPIEGRCIEITVSGKPIDPETIYRVATIDYLANGGDYMEPLTRHENIAESQNYLYEDIIEYFKHGAGKGKKVNPSDSPRMKSVRK